MEKLLFWEARQHDNNKTFGFQTDKCFYQSILQRHLFVNPFLRLLADGSSRSSFQNCAYLQRKTTPLPPCKKKQKTIRSILQEEFTLLYVIPLYACYYCGSLWGGLLLIQRRKAPRRVVRRRKKLSWQKRHFAAGQTSLHTFPTSVLSSFLHDCTSIGILCSQRQPQ